jgi:DNA-binding winged helix-turn-helix (wHTH) protein
MSAERAIAFGSFRLRPTQRLLLEGDKPVRLGSRDLEILIALVEHPGEVVRKNELIARAWPGTFVEESNLKFQVSALRRTLGDGNRYLATIPGRGYSFVAPINLAEVVPTRADTRWRNRPSEQSAGPADAMIGRADTVEKLRAQLPRQRLLTIVGPGGIGKTSVALAVAEGLLAAYEHGVWLIDLALVNDPGLVPSALAPALGLEISL